MIPGKHTRNFAAFYFICLVFNYAWYIFHGLSFTQLDPVFFYNKPDVTGNLFMITGLQLLLINSEVARMVMDLLFIVLPLTLIYFVWIRKTGNLLLALSVSIFCMMYGWFFSIMTFVSIEGFLGWMIVPIAFAGRTEKDAYYLRGCIRIVFLIVFFSTALWKIRAGGIFNEDQMSAILLQQHLELLTEGKGWFKNLILWLVENPGYSFLLYLAAFIVEFAFVIGFLTTSYDKLLLILFCCFVVFNYFLMNISYISWLPMAGVLYYSKVRQTA